MREPSNIEGRGDFTLRSGHGDDAVSAAKAGDTEALTALVDELTKGIIAALAAEFGPFYPQDLEDATQEAWLEFWANRSKVRATRKVQLKAWLTEVARNKVLDLIKSAERRLSKPFASVVPDDREPDEYLTLIGGADPAEEVCLRETERETRYFLNTALGRLSPSDRELVEGYFIVGQNTSKQATDAGCSEEALRKRRSRAIARMLQQLRSLGSAG